MKNVRMLGLLVVGAMFAGCAQRGETSESGDGLPRSGSDAPAGSTEVAGEGSSRHRSERGPLREGQGRSTVGEGASGAGELPGAASVDPSKTRVCKGVRVVEKFELASGHKFLGNTQLAPISDSGTVACMHAEDFTITECAFHADPRSTEALAPGAQKGNSGNWIVGGDGQRYAQLGQAIGLDGVPGGEYVVARPSPKNGASVPCVAPEGNDSAGTPAGIELAGACVIEGLAATTNATGLPVINYANLEVCTSSNPHPDGAAFVRIASNGSYCYRYAGAAMNDINGTERDANGVYYAGVERCHVIWSNGYEVPGAKRPSTKTYPAPGSVVTTTPVAWRPVTPVTVAND